MLPTFLELDELIEIIKKKYGLDLGCYAKSSLQRRLYRLCVLNGLQSSQELKDHITTLPSKNNLIEKITVSTTELFRDPGFWAFLKKDVLQKLSEKDRISICHMACSSGEEVISMAILLQEAGLFHKSVSQASDINTYLLHRAQQGAYPQNKQDLYENNYKSATNGKTFESYLEYSDGKQFGFRKDLLKNTQFNCHDLAVDTCKEKFDLILCRNVMIYFTPEWQTLVIQKLMNCIHPGGFLALGHNESVLRADSLSRLQPYYPPENIYRVF